MRTYDFTTTVEVDLDDILSEMDEDEVIELFETRIGRELHTSGASWIDLYEKRRSMTDVDFLKHIDKLIMNATGRIL